MPLFFVRFLRSSAEARIALNYFMLFAVFGIYTPYLQVLLKNQGFDERQIGFIQSAIDFAGLFAPFLWGWLSDHSHHRRALLATTIIGAGFCFTGFGWIDGFTLAIANALALGVFYRSVIPLTDGLVLRYLAEQGGDYGRPRSAGSFAFIGINLLLEALGVSGAAGRELVLGGMLATTALHAISVRLLPLTARERAERAEGVRLRKRIDWSVLLGGPFVIFLVAAFPGRVGIMGYYSFFSLYLKEVFHQDKIGYLWVLGPLSEIPIIFLSSRIIRRIGARNLFALGVGGAVVRLLGYALAPSIWFVIPLQFLHCLTFGAFHTSAMAIIQRLVPSDMKQTAMTVFHIFSIVAASVVGSALGGVLIHAYGFRTMYLVYSGLTLASLCAVLSLVREPAERG
ncbi:MAG: MFS transporter [Candidatus Sumerlaeota bacterium]|nr:MFS transporter [Candidatus Sumerlaeota bacterium]